MTDEKNRVDSAKAARFLRVFGPFLLLLAGLVAFSLSNRSLNRNDSQPSPSATTEGPAPTNSRPMAQSTPAPIATAIAGADSIPDESIGVPTTAVPTLQANRVARLVGPPPASSFPIEAAIQFYWQAVDNLPDGQVYALYLLDDKTEVLIGIFDEPNLGGGYQARFAPEELAIGEGNYHWEVRLLGGDKGEILGRSEPRIISFFEAS